MTLEELIAHWREYPKRPGIIPDYGNGMYHCADELEDWTKHHASPENGETQVHYVLQAWQEDSHAGPRGWYDQFSFASFEEPEMRRETLRIYRTADEDGPAMQARFVRVTRTVEALDD